MSQAFTKQLFLLQKNEREQQKKISTKKNSGAPSQVIEDVPRSPAF